jgi:hypothetical protein
MFEIINVTKPYHLNQINTINKSLVFYKNLLRIISKKKCYEFTSNMLFPVRWSKERSEFVIDFRTQKLRDIKGISLENINNFYKTNSNIYRIISIILELFNKSKNKNYWQQINIKKNETKFIPILWDSNLDIIYLEGIYNFCHYKNREGTFTNKNNRSILIDNSYETKSNIYDCLNNSFIKIPESYQLKSYLSCFNDFKSIIMNKSYSFNTNEEKFDFKLYDYLNVKYEYKISSNYCKDIILNQSHLNKKNDCKSLIQYLLYKEFVSYLKSLTNLESILIYEPGLEKNILLQDFKITQSNKQIDDLSNNNCIELNYFGVF